MICALKHGAKDMKDACLNTEARSISIVSDVGGEKRNDLCRYR